MQAEAESAKASRPVNASSNRYGAACVFAVAAVYLCWAAAPGLLWHDTGEFGAIAWRLSLSHPPGHPIHAMWTLGAQLGIPWGDLGFRANLSSVVAVALSLGAFYSLIRRWRPAITPGLAAALALAPLAMPAVIEQAVRSEVYALQLLITVGLAHGCFAVAAGRDQRSLIWLAALFGLAGANHSYVGLLWVPIAVASMVIGRSKFRAIVGAACAGLATLLSYSYLVMRATRGGEVGWGTPDTPAELWSTIRGEEWVKSLDLVNPHLNLGERWSVGRLCCPEPYATRRRSHLHRDNPRSAEVG